LLATTSAIDDFQILDPVSSFSLELFQMPATPVKALLGNIHNKQAACFF